MNIALLIDAIVRQTTVLIAELATNGGVRAPLSHIANQVFVDLAKELDAQGVSRKVSADMFGMALRTYQRKVQRLSESNTERGRSLWEAIYDFIRKRDIVDRRTILKAWKSEDETLVRGVLHDLVESGLIFATGGAHDTSFRAATEAELGVMAQARTRDTDELIWALVFRTGPVTVDALSKLGGIDRAHAQSTIERLVAVERVQREDGPDGTQPTYRATRFIVPLGADSGWEAAVFDHYHAVVRTITAKLHQKPSASAADTVGGSTYTLEVWDGHPMRDEVLGALKRFREQTSELRSRVRAYNERAPRPTLRQGVLIYGGQCVWEEATDADQ